MFTYHVFFRLRAVASSDGGGGLLVTGGVTPPPHKLPDEEYLSTSEIFKDGAWKEGPKLYYPVFDHCQVVLHGKVVVAGGRLGKEVTGKTWYLLESSLSKMARHVTTQSIR